VWHGEKFVDFVPEGSIATGIRDGSIVTPDVRALWKEYRRAKAK
jgi:hypothetical protein